MKIDVVQLELRRTHQIEIDIDYNIIYNAVAAVPIFQKEIGTLNVEHTAMLSLDNTGKIIIFFCGLNRGNRFRKGLSFTTVSECIAMQCLSNYCCTQSSKRNTRNHFERY